MSDDNNRLTAYLADNPRKIGMLFAIMLALSQATTASAAMGTTFV